MKEEYVFPHNNWYLEFTEEERPIVDNWKINIVKYSNNPCPSNHIKQYVLNVQEPIINQQPEDLSYLIDLFKQLKIK